MSQPYVDGIKDKVSHNFASILTVDQIVTDEARVTISVVCPDRWFLGDFAAITSGDGGTFAGEVESMDVCTGKITIMGVGRLSARVTPLPGLRAPGQRQARFRAARRLAAPIPRIIALTALAALGLSKDPFHEPFHARTLASRRSGHCAQRHRGHCITRHEHAGPSSGRRLTLTGHS
jgi:hypothetical protein